MTKLEKILVALDGSPRSPDVLAAAVELAQRTQARLWLYRAVGLPQELPALAFSRSPSDLAPMLLELAEEGLKKYAATVPAELLGGVRASVAIPWQGVCEAAKQADADLVVIGSHGYHGLDRVLGTTAARIVNHCDRTVLVVKASPTPAKR